MQGAGLSHLPGREGKGHGANGHVRDGDSSDDVHRQRRSEEMEKKKEEKKEEKKEKRGEKKEKEKEKKKKEKEELER